MPVYAYVPAYGYVQVAGTYAVDATNTIVTFTPIAPYPANTLVFWYTNANGAVRDVAGNALVGQYYQFTTGTTADTAAPTLMSVAPIDGAAGLGPYTTVTLTFSESVSPATINQNTLAMFDGACESR